MVFTCRSALILLSFLCFGSMFGQEDDEMAILAVLNKDAATWRSGDLKAHAECWVERPYGKIIVSTASGQVMDIPVSVVMNPPEGVAGKGGSAELSNFSFQIEGNMAWVSHDEVSTSLEGVTTKSFEFRFLEKVDGEWKLIGQSIHVYPEGK